MRSTILEKQKTREALEIATAVELEKEKEREIQEKLEREAMEALEKEKSITQKSFMTELPDENYVEEIPLPKMPTFIIPFQETSFFIKNFGEIPIEVINH